MDDTRVALVLGAGGVSPAYVAEIIAALGYNERIIVSQAITEPLTEGDVVIKPRSAHAEYVGMDLAEGPDLTAIAMMRKDKDDVLSLRDIVMREIVCIREAEPVDLAPYVLPPRHRDHPTSPKATLRAQRPQRQRKHKKARRR